DRDAVFPRRDHLRVVGLHRRRDHDRIRAVHMLGLMAMRNLDPQPRQTARRAVLRQVGAAHLVAEVGQHLGDARHARAADAHEMDVTDLVLHRAMLMQRSATTRAASGLPSARALRAISRSRLRSSPRIICASFCGVRSRCWISSAAPWSARNLPLAVWWSSTACGNGTRMLAMPPADSSAMVTAPARQITRSASA